MQDEFNLTYFGWLFVTIFVASRHLHLAGEPEDSTYPGTTSNFSRGTLETAVMRPLSHSDSAPNRAKRDHARARLRIPLEKQNSEIGWSDPARLALIFDKNTFSRHQRPCY
jgi:hypothetical protein